MFQAGFPLTSPITILQFLPIPGVKRIKGGTTEVPELRQNLATKEWVIIAKERAKRPKDLFHPPGERNGPAFRTFLPLLSRK